MQQQDVNKVIDNLSAEYSQQLAQANKNMAILKEQNERLQQEVDRLRSQTDASKKENADTEE